MMKARGRPAGHKALLVGALASLVLWGCDGNNLFGPGVGLGPQIVDFQVPVSVPSGDEMSLQARAVALVRVDSIVFTAVGGDFALRRVQLSTQNETDFTTFADFEIPSPVTDTLIVVTAVAHDAQGNRSLPAVDTVRAVDTTPPGITASIVVADSVVGQGHDLHLTVQAQDNVGLRWIGFRILSADSVVMATDSIATTGTARNQSFTYTVPLTFPLGTYSAFGFAHDVDGNVGEAPSPATFRVVFIDETRPVVNILAPAANAQVAEGDSVLVSARVTDSGGFALVRMEGVAFRGDPNLGTNTVVARYTAQNITLSPSSADSTLARYLRATAVLGAETVNIIVTATDLQGNVGADTLQIMLQTDVDPPIVTIEIPGAGADFAVGDSLTIRATVSDPAGFVRSGVNSVRFEGVALRGDPNLLTQVVVPRFVPVVVPLSPPRVLNQTILRTLAPTADTTEESAYLIVTATDVRGNVGADTVLVDLEAGIGGPSVVILDPTTSSGTPLGDSLLVRARLQHPAGTVRVVYDGVAHRGDPNLGTDQVVQRFAPRTVNFSTPVLDTILARYIQPVASTVSETVWIRAFAFDPSNFVGADSVAITVGGPRVTVPDLVSGQTVSAGQSIVIRVLADDPSGVDVVEVLISGVATATLQDAALIGQNPNAVDITFNYTVPPATPPGSLNLLARARNQSGILGQAPLVTLNVQGAAGPDTTPPEVRIVIEPQGASGDPNRVEATDPIRVSLTARDNTGGTGILRAAYTVRIVRRDNLADTLWVTDTIPDTPVPPGVGGTVTRIFNPTFLTQFRDATGALFFDPVNRPDTLDLEFYGWASDAAPVPNCAAAVSPTTFQQLACQTRAIPTTLGPPPAGARSSVSAPAGGNYTFAAQAGQRITLALVSGQTVQLPIGGRIADAVVDTTLARERIYVANIGLSRLEVFDLNTRTFGAPILVGAEPWGLAFDRTNNNQLLVANSGGTNLSYVNLTTLSEIQNQRIFTPNQFLLNIHEEISQAGGLTYTVEPPIDFSDRPQFVEMDINGRLVYSTRPTGVSPDGTVRIGQLGVNPLVPEPANRPQVVIFTDYAAGVAGDGDYAVSNVCCTPELGPSIRLGTFQPFTPRVNPQVQVNSSSYTTNGGTAAAVVELAANPLITTVPAIFRPRVRGGEKWVVENVGLSDTTFIAASGTGNRIAMGGGASAGIGRIMLWDAANLVPSAAIEVIDLVNNASERVLGVAMNQDGRLGVARGLFGAYFFDPDLRLLGTVAISAGGGGVALHPLHTVANDGTQPVGSRLAFVPVGNRSIEILDTFNFTRIGRVFVKDLIVGPVRAVLPLNGENPAGCLVGGIAVAGYVGPDYSSAIASSCIVVKLVGSALGGGVAVINVTKADILSGP